LTLHNAPSVTYPLGRSRFLALMLLGCWLMAAGVTLWWWRSAPPGDWGPLLGGLSWLLAGLVMAAGWHRSPVGELHWDGEDWFWDSESWRDGSALPPPQVVLDLQSTMLLRLGKPTGGVWWLWAERAAWPAHWLDLRRAVHAPQKPAHFQVSDDGERPSA
jgi:toxin CptA